MTAKALPAILSVAAVVLGGLIAGLSSSFGAFSTHMAMHLAAMNVVAPLIAVALFRLSWGRHSSNGLWIAAATQLVVLLAWHMPFLHEILARSALLTAATATVLVASSVTFWLVITARAEDAPWQAILALMLTGKVACLMGGILVFAPRALYEAPHHSANITLADQQLAGMLMLAICPLSYVVAGITIAAQMMMRLERDAMAPLREPLAR